MEFFYYQLLLEVFNPAKGWGFYYFQFIANLRAVDWLFNNSPEGGTMSSSSALATTPPKKFNDFGEARVASICEHAKELVLIVRRHEYYVHGKAGTFPGCIYTTYHLGEVAEIGVIERREYAIGIPINRCYVGYFRGNKDGQVKEISSLVILNRDVRESFNEIEEFVGQDSLPYIRPRTELVIGNLEIWNWLWGKKRANGEIETVVALARKVEVSLTP